MVECTMAVQKNIVTIDDPIVNVMHVPSHEGTALVPVTLKTAFLINIFK